MAAGIILIGFILFWILLCILLNRKSLAPKNNPTPDTQPPIPPRSVESNNPHAPAPKDTSVSIIETGLGILKGLLHRPTPPWERKITDEFMAVRRLIEEEDYPVIVVTGGAGTGKTTLIDWLIDEKVVNAVVAPTGAAALNCRGKTIHSMFQIPPRIILPKEGFDSHLRQETINILQHTNILVIDEISMVRADTLDAIDKRLRSFLDKEKPFGGLRVLMIGDPYQLPPVVPRDKQELFSPHREECQWESGWFFDSHAFHAVKNIKYIELSRVFRQGNDETEYIFHLNQLRKCNGLEEGIAYFNRACLADEVPNARNTIYITTDNATAAKTNEEELAKLPGMERHFTAQATGAYAELVRKEMAFPAKNDPDAVNNMKNLPAPYELKLKIGALVMLLINDAEKNFVNGTTAVVLELSENSISLKLSNGRKVAIIKHLWKSEKLLWDRETKTFIRETDGEFTQFPLALAWAITTHKSQGRTLTSVFVNFKGSAFAPGQTYVALSRTRHIKDLKLSRPLSLNDFKQDIRLNEYATSTL